jgi:hypothetical protein
MSSRPVAARAATGLHEVIVMTSQIHSNAALFAAFVLAAASTPARSAEPVCDMRLAVQLTPDVPDPRAASFLSSLVGDPGYQLIWRGKRDDAMTELELTGPGPDYRCQAVVDAMRKDSRVQSILIHGKDEGAD